MTISHTNILFMVFREHPFTDLLLLIHVLYMNLVEPDSLESILTLIFDSNEIYALINCIGVFDTIDSLDDISSSRITDSFNINALSATLIIIGITFISSARSR